MQILSHLIVRWYRVYRPIEKTRCTQQRARWGCPEWSAIGEELREVVDAVAAAFVGRYFFLQILQLAGERGGVLLFNSGALDGEIYQASVAVTGVITRRHAVVWYYLFFCHLVLLITKLVDVSLLGQWKAGGADFGLLMAALLLSSFRFQLTLT